MGTFTTSGGTKIYCLDWGSGKPVAFSHGWPLSDEAWSEQLRLVAENGYPGAPHGLVGAYRDAFNADLLAFLSS